MYELNQMFDEIVNEAKEEFENSQNELKVKLKEEEFKKTKVMKHVWLFMLNKLLAKLKIKITVFWADKVVFDYEIPKN